MLDLTHADLCWGCFFKIPGIYALTKYHIKSTKWRRSPAAAHRLCWVTSHSVGVGEDNGPHIVISVSGAGKGSLITITHHSLCVKVMQILITFSP